MKVFGLALVLVAICSVGGYVLNDINTPAPKNATGLDNHIPGNKSGTVSSPKVLDHIEVTKNHSGPALNGTSKESPNVTHNIAKDHGQDNTPCKTITKTEKDKKLPTMTTENPL